MAVHIKAVRTFHPGIHKLYTQHKTWLKNRKIGLLTHMAAIDTDGKSSVKCIQTATKVEIVAIFTPEHGFLCNAPAGKKVPNGNYEAGRIPVFSLYGNTRKPTTEMLRNIDTIVVDLQDLGARPYTYVSTLKLVMESAQENGKDVIVADRPIPLPEIVDGPMLKQGFESFVAAIKSPMCYGMTPAETAIWLKQSLKMRLNLKVAKMTNYYRQPAREAGWHPWIPPSPGIKSWKSGQCYTATVFSEALPILDIARHSKLAFQVVGAPGIDHRELARNLNSEKLNGIKFRPVEFVTTSKQHKNKMISGVRLTVTNPSIFQPVSTAVTILYHLQNQLSVKRLWSFSGTRPDFFDKLFGTNSVRKMLMSGKKPSAIIKSWQKDLTKFNKVRKKCLLYSTKTRCKNPKKQ